MKELLNKFKNLKFLKIKSNKNIKISFFDLVILISVPTIIMSILTGSLVYKNLGNTGKVTTTNNKYVNEFIGTYNKLLDEYFEDLDESKLIDAAIDGMLSYTGDDYTIYMDENATDALNEKLEGTYEGVGISISLNDDRKIYIVEVFENSPAAVAGLMKNDIIISINGEGVEGKSTEEASKIIKNSESNKVSIIVDRNGSELSFDMEIKTLIVPALSSSIKDVNGKKIGYIYLETFSSTLNTQVENTLISIENEGIDSLIIDVRYNTGGYLTSCTKRIE